MALGGTAAAVALVASAAGVAVASGPAGSQGSNSPNGPSSASGQAYRYGDGSGLGLQQGVRSQHAAHNHQGAQNQYGARNQQGPGDGSCLTADVPAAALTEEQISTLLHMREEEQLAHDLYAAFGEEWDNPVFDRIAASEARHAAAVQNLLDRYGLSDPSPEAGFADSDLQQMWDELLAQGMTSESDALAAGRAVEVADIADLEAALADGQPADITQVYENLLAGSQRHLEAFGG
jgi:hypothetical protein